LPRSNARPGPQASGCYAPLARRKTAWPRGRVDSTCRGITEHMAEKVTPALHARGDDGPSRKRGLLALVMAALLGVGGTVAVPMAAQAAETPQISIDVTEIPGTGISIAIEGTGFGDVKALPGQAEPHVYVKLSEIGADLSEVGQDDTSISAEVAADGTIDDVLDVPLAELDQAKSYEVISYAVFCLPEETTLYARAVADIDWAALFPAIAQP